MKLLQIALSLLLVLSPIACASVQSDTKNETQQVIASRNPRIVSRFGDLELEVRMATPAEVPEEDYKVALYGVPYGGASAGLGVLAASSALVVGGAIAPLCAYIYIHDKGIADSINEALINADFTSAISKAMKGRINKTFTKKSAPNMKIDIIIQSFGLVGNSFYEPHCFVVSADFILSRGGVEVMRDRLQISNVNRSMDAPPPQCASLKRFAKNKARLFKDTLAEYAEVLAVMAVDRIQKGILK